jgi:hypothetical protein
MANLRDTRRKISMNDRDGDGKAMGKKNIKIRQ